MQINLLSIFKYENSFEKSVGYAFVQIIDTMKMNHFRNTDVPMSIT